MPNEAAKVAAKITVDVQPAVAGLESFKKATSEVNAEIKSLIGSTKTAQNVLAQISPLYAQVAATIQNAQGKEITSTEAAELRKLQIIENGTAAQLGVLELTEARKQAIQGQVVAKAQAIQDESLARQIAALDVAEARKQLITQESETKQLLAMEQAEARRLAILEESGARQQAIAQTTAAKIADAQTVAAAKAQAIAMKAAAQQEAIQIQAQARAEYMAGRAQAFHESHSFGGIFRRTSMHLLSATALFGGLDLLKESILDIDKQMAGMKQVLPELEHSEELASAATKDFIDIAHQYGQAVNLVIESGKLWGRQYKDVDTVMKMVNATTLLSVVDNLDLAEANRALEATINQYNYSASEAMRITDSWSNVSHNAQIAARDLAEANERTASVARQVGVDFDHLQGFVTAAVRATGQPGANIGNMLKTVFGSIHSDAAVKEIEALGVAMKRVGKDGKEEWRPIQDVLYDVIAATEGATMSTEDLNKAMAGGKFQWAKLSAMLGDLPTILNATALSLNSTGKSGQLVGVQIETLQSRLLQLKASLLGLINDKAAGGFTDSLKSIVITLDRIMEGLNKIPDGIYKLAGAAAGIWALARALNAAQAALKAIAAAEGLVAMASAAIQPILLAVGAAVSLYAWYLGNAAEKEAALKKEQEEAARIAEERANRLRDQAEYVGQLSRLHDQFIAQLKAGNLEEARAVKIKSDLAAVDRALAATIGEDAAARVRAANWNADAIDKEREAIENRAAAITKDTKNRLELERTVTMAILYNARDRIDAMNQEIATTVALLRAGVQQEPGKMGYKAKIDLDTAKLAIAEKEAADAQAAIDELNRKISDLEMAGVKPPPNSDTPNPTDSAKSQLSELTSVYRNALQTMENDAKTYWQGIYKAQEDSLQKQIDALRSESDEEIRIRQRVKEIDDELRQEEIAQRRADRLQEIKDAQNQLEELRRKRQAILDDVIVYVKDGQRIRQADQEKLRQIDNDIIEAQKKLDRAVEDDRRATKREQLEAEKQQLQDRAQKLASEREEQAKHLQALLEDMRTNHQEQLKALDEYWTGRLAEGAVQQEVERMITNQGYQQALNDYQAFLNAKASMQRANATGSGMDVDALNAQVVAAKEGYDAAQKAGDAAAMKRFEQMADFYRSQGATIPKSMTLEQARAFVARPPVSGMKTPSFSAPSFSTKIDFSGITAALGKLSTANITIDKATITARQVVLAGAGSMAQYGYTDR